MSFYYDILLDGAYDTEPPGEERLLDNWSVYGIEEGYHTIDEPVIKIAFD